MAGKSGAAEIKTGLPNAFSGAAATALIATSLSGARGISDTAAAKSVAVRVEKSGTTKGVSPASAPFAAAFNGSAC